MFFLETYEVNKTIAFFKESIQDLNRALQPSKLESQYRDLSKDMQEPSFWLNTKQAKKIAKDATAIRQKLDDFIIWK